jgi:hypothetical protein
MQLHAFLISATDRDEWSASHAGCPTANMDVSEATKFLVPAGTRIRIPCQPIRAVAYHYTDRAITASLINWVSRNQGANNREC